MARSFWHGSVSRGMLHHELMSVAIIAFRECRLVHARSWRQRKLEDEIIGLLPPPDGRRLRMRRSNGAVRVTQNKLMNREFAEVAARFPPQPATKKNRNEVA